MAKISNRGFEDARYDELCAYLARAEEIYMMSKDHGVWIEGLNKLISIYFTLNNWDRIVDCYKKLLAICADQEDPQEFLDTFRSVLMLQDKLDNIYLKELVNVVTRSKNRLKFSSKQSKSLNIHVAKCFHHIADHSKDPKESETYRTLAPK